ncbi:MAG TPA: hypothetical protein VFT30_00485, partial [Nitrospira sp.]|nr:hypothetical protein [Nitrospira sp.]
IEVQRHITEALIEYDHESIVITRPPKKVRKGDGSIAPDATEPDTLLPQDLYFSGVTGDDVRQVTVNGETIMADFVLVGMPDADFEEEDLFTARNRNFRIVGVHNDTRWQRKAWVVEVK